MLKLKSNSLLIITILLLQHFTAVSQQQKIKSTDDLIQQQNFINASFEPHKHSFLLLKNRNLVVRYNPFSLSLGLAMYIYQNVVSPQFSADCMYSPSCSDFSKALIKNKGLITGMMLTADRLTRCNRMAAMDIKTNYFDPKDHKVHESTDIYHIHK